MVVADVVIRQIEFPSPHFVYDLDGSVTSTDSKDSTSKAPPSKYASDCVVALTMTCGVVVLVPNGEDFLNILSIITLSCYRVRNGPQNDVRKRFPDWSSSDEASPAKTPRRNEATPLARRPSGSAPSNGASDRSTDAKNDRPVKKTPTPAATASKTSSSVKTSNTTASPAKPMRRKLSEIQFQERRQLLLCSWPNATEKSLRRAIECTETAEEADDWFFKFGESKAPEPKSDSGRKANSNNR